MAPQVTTVLRPRPGHGHNGGVSPRYTIEEADALVPEVAGRMARLFDLQQEAAARLALARRRARGNGHGGGLDPEVAGNIAEGLEWFEERGLEVRGTAPPLVDFPARYGGRDVLLCWTEGEERIGWYHLPEEGFAGRRPVEELRG
ncbi:MAG TPA: DUF2203 domain-containing protein [Acidimicrobiia bacterium]|nr:DUF2203 domain-containing protein [Acidimicrobiia bacterium]